MIQAFAPRMPRGGSWVWPAIVGIAFACPSSEAQAPKAAAPVPPPKPAAPVPPPKPADAGAEPADKPDDAATNSEIYIDPNAKKTLAIFSPLVASGPPIRIGNPPDDRTRVQNMAARIENIDRAFLRRYIDHFAVELSRRDNLNAILNPPPTAKPGSPQSRALEVAIDALNKPMVDGRAQNNAEFLTEYSRTLFESSLPKLLDNNFLSRIDAMIVLGTAGSPAPAALDLYIAQIKKADQVFPVKEWAARGITNAAQRGRVDLDAARTIQAAEALVGLLDGDPKLPWFVQMRALETLGSIRLATNNNSRAKVDAASVAMRFLTDREARPAVRAWAAWALGMMRVSSQVAPYNFEFLGYEIGECAVDLGRRIVEEYDENPASFDKEMDEAAHLASLLIFQVYPSLVGQDNVRESGLLNSTHPNLGPARPFLTKVDARVKAIAREAYELLRAGGAGHKARRDSLDRNVADLKQLLAQNLPKGRRLTPGGPEFTPSSDQVARAPRR